MSYEWGCDTCHDGGHRPTHYQAIVACTAHADASGHEAWANDAESAPGNFETSWRTFCDHPNR